MKAARGIALTLLALVAWALWTPDLARIALSPLHINATPFYVMETLFALGSAGNWTQAWAAVSCLGVLGGSGHRTAGACWDRLCAVALILERQCGLVQRVARRVTDLSGQADGSFERQLSQQQAQ